MAEVGVTVANVGADSGESHDLKSILSGEGRDFLVRNTGDQVKIDNLDGKIVGIYFSASWCDPCQQFTPKLVGTHTELSSKGAPFEVVFVSADRDEDSFEKYFSEMPWLAVPFSDSDSRERLDKLFDAEGIPHLVILNGSGKVVTDDGVELVSVCGSESYPFTKERIDELQAIEDARKKNQTLQNVLVSSSRDFLISNNGDKVPVSQLEGKIVCLYFCVSSHRKCSEFTPKLVEMQKELKEKGESFEVVLVPLDRELASFELGFASMPWLAIPFRDKTCDRLVWYFDVELETVPAVVVIGSDGNTLTSDAAELLGDHGVDAYPFSQEKLAELAEKDEATQSLESLLVSGEKNYVIGNGGAKVRVSELVGKNILLLFSAHWCPPCRALLPKLIEAYHQIKSKDANFEVIFISSDRDQASFDDFFSTMPWLALPFGDDRKYGKLRRIFKTFSIPSLVAIGPSGRTVAKEVRKLVMTYGADAYPFTEERLLELEESAAAEEVVVAKEKEGYVCDGEVCYKV